MEKTAKMVEEITIKRRMTREVKSKLKKRILCNCLIALGIILYIGAIDLVYMYANQEIANIVLKVLAMVVMLLTVITFEVAYRKDSGKITICGIEFFIVSIMALYIPQIYTRLENLSYKVLMFSPIFCATYYIAKSIIIYKKTEKEYQNSLSDVKEILKDEV